MKTSSGTYSAVSNVCPTCGKPYTYVGDFPEEGFAPGQAPFCQGHPKYVDELGHPYKPTDSCIKFPYGWICPVCHRGLAPWINQCPCKEENNRFPLFPNQPTTTHG